MVFAPIRVPNVVFQTVLFRFITSACDRGKRLPRDQECLKTPVFESIWCLSPMADPDHPLNTPLGKTLFRTHRLLLLGFWAVYPASFFLSFSPLSRSHKAGHNKAGRSDFRNQRFETDTRNMWKMREVPLTQKNEGLRRDHRAKTCKIRLTDFIVTGFWSQETNFQVRTSGTADVSLQIQGARN